MVKPDDPRELATDILERSICRVKVGACVADVNGIVSWGWNAVGTGTGIHAEIHAIRRANQRRLRGATLYVASTRLRTGRPVTSKPCHDCQDIIDGWCINVIWRDADGKWVME